MNHDFYKLITSTKNARLRIRLLAISHFIEGESRTNIAKYLKVSRTSVNNWVKSYLDNGLDGLNEKPRSGRPSRLTREELHKLKTYLIECAVKSKDGHLQIKDIKKYIKITFNVIYQPTNIYYLLHKLNLSSKIKKYDNQTQSEEAQGRLKKF